VVDAADAAFRDHIEVTRQVLAELGIEQPQWMLLNKIDLVAADQREALALELADAIQLSARSPADVGHLREQIMTRFLGALEETSLLIPWAQHKLVHTIHEQCRVLSEEHGEEGTRLVVRGPRTVLDRLRGDLEAS